MFEAQCIIERLTDLQDRFEVEDNIATSIHHLLQVFYALKKEGIDHLGVTVNISHRPDEPLTVVISTTDLNGHHQAYWYEELEVTIKKTQWVRREDKS